MTVALCEKQALAEPTLTMSDPDFWGDIPEECRQLEAKWILNGFPKSGLHLVTNMLRPVVKPMPPGQFRAKHWSGTFREHSWSNEWANMDLMYFQMSQVQMGHYLKGHIGHTLEIEDFLWKLGVAKVFIFRDLRDVVVSQAHHILNENDDRFVHPGKDEYRALPDFDAVLEACIVGLGEWPGVLARWELYAPWRDVKWVLPVRYERAREIPHIVAGELLKYSVARVGGLIGISISDVGEGYAPVCKMMADASQQTEFSPTFRKGEIGGWREAFTERHKQLFKQVDENDWLIQLGYERDHNW